MAVMSLDFQILNWAVDFKFKYLFKFENFAVIFKQSTTVNRAEIMEMTFRSRFRLPLLLVEHQTLVKHRE